MTKRLENYVSEGPVRVDLFTCVGGLPYLTS